MPDAATYLENLKKRGAESHVYRQFQLIGLEIATILGDQRHKSLYIKLAKERDGDRLRAIAKDVADRSNVKNKGAYFMRVVAEDPTTQPKVSKVIKVKAVKAKGKPGTATVAKSGFELMNENLFK